MDDPTIFEDYSAFLQNVMEQIKAGGDPDSIMKKEEFKKSIQDARLKSASSPSYFIMTINMNGKGITDRRVMLVSIIMRCFFSDIIFCQELPGYFEKKVVDKCGALGYQYVKNGNQSAVLWRTEDFDGSTEDLKTTDRSMIQLRDEVKGASEVLSRIAMVKLTSRKSSGTVLAVSYHGRHTGDEVKESQFQGLNTFLQVELPDNVVVPNYALSPRQQCRQEKKTRGRPCIPYKDNFVYFSDDGKIRVTWTRPFQFEDNEDSDLTKKDQAKVKSEMATGTDATDMLDHDPIVGVLEFPKPAQPTGATGTVVRGLSKDFKEMTI
ncbi:hypothetical protein OS493_029915 [Desmophyllum pertusum]|uniref:Uncharacterized protein n=1 Tax=Desmophyllum pertusum TaxID=174260 RepID=A0A9W9Y8Z6_9CNID|nr:hypothetical protein OS493_029915 [Desmophyllum pertusum]